MEKSHAKRAGGNIGLLRLKGNTGFDGFSCREILAIYTLFHFLNIFLLPILLPLPDAGINFLSYLLSSFVL
jgi:hypothetical protein